VVSNDLVVKTTRWPLEVVSGTRDGATRMKRTIDFVGYYFYGK
jgi:hypothetical protein